MAKKYDMTIDKASKFLLRVQALQEDGVTPRDLTGYTAKLHIKKYSTDVSPVKQYATPTDLVITALTGMVTVNLTDTETATFTFKSGVYDLLIISASGSAERILQGGVVVSENITTE